MSSDFFVLFYFCFVVIVIIVIVILCLLLLNVFVVIRKEIIWLLVYVQDVINMRDICMMKNIENVLELLIENIRILLEE